MPIASELTSCASKDIPKLQHTIRLNTSVTVYQKERAKAFALALINLLSLISILPASSINLISEKKFDYLFHRDEHPPLSINSFPSFLKKFELSSIEILFLVPAYLHCKPQGGNVVECLGTVQDIGISCSILLNVD